MTYKIIVLVNPDFTFEETRGDNNNASKQITVLGPPDLEFGAITFSTGTEVGGGDDVVVSAPLFNLQPATVMEVGVALYIDSMAGAPVASTTVTSPLKSGLDPVMVSFTYHAPFVEADTTVTVFMVVDPADDIAETDELNNVVQRDLLIKDMRQDLTIDSDSIYFMWGGVQSDTTKNQFGRTINIRADVSNLGLKGASNFTVEFGISGTIGGNSFNWTMTPRVYAAIGAGPTAVKTVQTNWTVNITAAGTYQIWVFLDPFGNYSEKVETNNLASNDFEVTIPELLFSVTVDTTKYDAGDTVIITIKGTYVNPPKVGVPNLGSIRVELLDSRGNTVEVDDLFDLRSLNAQGSLTVEATLPSELESGQYSISVSALGSTGSSDSFDVSGVSTSRGIPLLLWIIVIIAIAGVVAGFTIYTYVYGLGKLVECGECGAFIPAASKRCPKCGVEFEVGTMKCSECGAWVPAESAECPNCGVRFVGEVSGEEDYVEKMRKEYDEMVSKYRELARAELGKKFSDKRFEEWWRQQPTYISFEDWLAKEEERRKEGAVPCPVCNTLNPKEATVCHKCGTVFGAPRVAPPVTRAPPPGGAAPPAQPAAQPYAQQPVYVERQAPPSTQAAPGQQPAVPKMVIRRPVDRKVVPKKIIRTPTGAIVETEEGQNNEEQQ
jgi:ribosomal protein L40E